MSERKFSELEGLWEKLRKEILRTRKKVLDVRVNASIIKTEKWWRK
jgi:hypothetical protein